MRNYLYILLIAGIFMLGFFIRFYSLNNLPHGLNQDETALGYNAYSILKTGKDEYGYHLPLYFKSFGDYKLPVYVYLTVATIKLFGLTAFAVRFWSALAGVLTIIVVFFLLLQLSKRKDISLVTSMLLAINPWHIFFSRVAFEVNVANFFLVLGVYFFILSVKRKNQLLIGLIAFLSFGISLYTYNVTRLVSPAMVIMLSLWFRKDLQKLSAWKKSLFILIFAAIVVPFLVTLFGGSGLTSQKGVLIFGGESLAGILEYRSYLALMPGIVTKILFNNILLILFEYLRNIVGFFNPQFFFLSGGPLSVSTGNTGMFYLFEALTIPLGCIMIVKKYPALRIFILWFLVILAIIGISTNAPHATRDFTMVVPLIVCSAAGMVTVYYWIREQKKFIFLSTGILGGLFIAYSILYFVFSYMFRFPVLAAKTNREEDKNLAVYLQRVEKNYQTIVIDTDADFIYTSLIFYQKYPPQQVIKEAVRDNNFSFIKVVELGKYQFRKIDLSHDISSPHMLIVTGDKKLPLPVMQTFNYPTRDVVLYADGVFAQFPVTDTAYTVYTTDKK